MKTYKETNKYRKYFIKKSPELGYNHMIVAKFWIDDRGKLLYIITVPDKDVEQVLSKAQREGGLYMPIPFSSHKEEVAITGLKKHFVPVTDVEHFADAIEFNLKSGLVELED
jgi:hypothetical protein